MNEEFILTEIVEIPKFNRKSKKECQKKYREANKDKLKEKKKIYRETHKDKIRENDKIYKETNKDKIKEYNDTHKEGRKKYNEKHNKIYFDTHKNEIKEQHKRYYEIHKEKISKRAEKYRKTKKDIENHLRKLKGLPKIGEGRISETFLYNIIRKYYEGLDIEVIHHGRLQTFIKGQHFDIYIPSLKMAIEYQGKQHYEPIKWFGGIDSLTYIKELDEKKKRLCNEKGIKLIEFRYDEPLNSDYVAKRLRWSK